jgi:hypothetical protein
MAIKTKVENRTVQVMFVGSATEDNHHRKEEFDDGSIVYIGNDIYLGGEYMSIDDDANSFSFGCQRVNFSDLPYIRNKILGKGLGKKKVITNGDSQYEFHELKERSKNYFIMETEDNNTLAVPRSEYRIEEIDVELEDDVKVVKGKVFFNGYNIGKAEEVLKYVDALIRVGKFIEAI